MTQPWLTLIVPTHEGGAWLDIALRSIEVAEGLEIIVLDSSASPDAAARTVAAQGRMDIAYHHRPDLSNWRLKANAGLAMAAAGHVGLLHQDDFWRPGRAARLRELVTTAPHATMIVHAADFVDADGRSLGAWRSPLPSGSTPIEGAVVRERLLVQNFICSSAVIMRRDAALDCGGFDEALWYTADWDLYLKLVELGDVLYVDDPLAAFRLHGSSMTVSGSSDRRDFADQIDRVLERHLPLAPALVRARVERIARASAEVNVALAQLAGGRLGAAWTILARLGRLGPVSLLRYWSWSRLGERVASRLKAGLARPLRRPGRA
jgi:GT2 family glycosyltransferase